MGEALESVTSPRKRKRTMNEWLKLDTNLTRCVRDRTTGSSKYGGKNESEGICERIRDILDFDDTS